MKKYAVIYDNELAQEFDQLEKAMAYVKAEIQDCYSKGERYHIFKNVCIGFSDVVVSFSEEDAK
jgi:hypothetical protein